MDRFNTYEGAFLIFGINLAVVSTADGYGDPAGAGGGRRGAGDYRGRGWLDRLTISGLTGQAQRNRWVSQVRKRWERGLLTCLGRRLAYSQAHQAWESSCGLRARRISGRGGFLVMASLSNLRASAWGIVDVIVSAGIMAKPLSVLGNHLLIRKPSSSPSGNIIGHYPDADPRDFQMVGIFRNDGAVWIRRLLAAGIFLAVSVTIIWSANFGANG